MTPTRSTVSIRTRHLSVHAARNLLLGLVLLFGACFFRGAASAQFGQMPASDYQYLGKSNDGTGLYIRESAVAVDPSSHERNLIAELHYSSEQHASNGSSFWQMRFDVHADCAKGQIHYLEEAGFLPAYMNKTGYLLPNPDASKAKPQPHFSVLAAPAPGTFEERLYRYLCSH